jgi:hypothetical protein
MKKVIASASLLAFGAVGIQSAHADWAAGADKPWTVSGTLRGFYDDNINTQPDGPNRVDSFGFEVNPAVTVSINSGPTTITGSYNYSLNYYGARNGNKTDQAHDVELFVNHNFNDRYSASLTESFIDSQEPEVLGSNGGAPLRANGDNFHNNIDLKFRAQVTKLLGFDVGYANDYWDYTGSLPVTVPGVPSYGASLNRMEQSFTLNSRWTIQPETVGIFGYQFNWTHYLQIASIGGPGPYISPAARDSYIRQQSEHGRAFR